MRLRSGGQSAFIRRQSKKIDAKLRKRGAVSIVDTPGRRKDQWARTITEGVADTPPPQDLPPWIEKKWRICRAIKQLLDHATPERKADRKAICWKMEGCVRSVSEISRPQHCCSLDSFTVEERKIRPARKLDQGKKLISQHKSAPRKSDLHSPYTPATHLNHHLPSMRLWMALTNSEAHHSSLQATIA